MTDSPRLEEVFAADLVAHRLLFTEDGRTSCECGAILGDEDDAHDAHVAERLAARLLAHRDLLLEALGAERYDGNMWKGEYVAWRFPVSEEAQK